MMGKKHKMNPFSMISVTLGVIGIVSLAVYLAYHFLDKRAYHRKWEDYDDCGMV